MIKKTFFFILCFFILNLSLFSYSFEKGGRVLIYTNYEPKTLIPIFEYNNEIKNIYNLVYSGLLGIDDNFEYYPDLAVYIPTVYNRGVEYINDKMVVTYKLRDLIFWHDGKPITSEDIKFTWQLYINTDIEKDKNIDIEGYRLIQRIETPDEKTIKIYFDKNYSNYKSLFKYILPKHAFVNTKISKNHWFNKNPIGSGPFKLVEWKNNYLVLDSNKRYYKNKSYLDQIVIMYSKFNNDILENFNNKKIHILDTDLKNISYNKNFVKIPENYLEEIIFNTKDSYMSDLNLRKAIAYLINREELLKNNKDLVPAWSDIHPNSQIYDNYLKNKYFYDYKKSNYYFDKSLWRVNPKTGFRENNKKEELNLNILFTKSDIHYKIANYLKNNLKILGVKTTLKEVNEEDIKNNNYDILIYKRFITTDGSEREYYFSENRIIPNGKNFSKYSNQTLQAILSDVSRLSDKNSQKIINNILAEEIPTLPLFIYVKNILVADNLNNFRPNLYSGNTWNSFEWWLN
ncbi:MAG: peptide ABC transporter substrate-binding protein [Candidatus Sericytochromatia bacterium]|nr:MAG: peptide ABC transporter substrate-binding protein [Candidatus Sericytochromatia bacterium]